MRTKGTAGRPTVRAPTTRSAVPKDIRVPEIVTGAPLGTSVVSTIEKPVGFAVNVEPATVKTGREGSEGSAIVMVPITTTEAPSDTGVPDNVTAGPFGRRLLPSTENPGGLATNVWPPTENSAGTGRFEVKGTVLVPITRFDDPRDTGVPDIVINVQGVIKVPATENPNGLEANDCA